MYTYITSYHDMMAFIIPFILLWIIMTNWWTITDFIQDIREAKAYLNANGFDLPVDGQ
jgi:hypothetical protein